MRIVLSLALALHGLIHLIGFVVPWRLAEIRGFTYSTSVTWGRIDVGEGGARALGLGWLLAAFAFIAAAVGVWQAAPWSLPMVTAAASVSVVLCVAGSPAAAPGLIVNFFILAAVLIAGTMGLRLRGSP